MKLLIICFILSLYLWGAHSRSFQSSAAFGGDVSSVPYDSPNAVQSLQDLKAIGANWVCIVVTWFQDNINSTTINPNKYSQNYESVASIINNATSLGLKVFLKPHVDVTDGTWRAWIGHYFSDSDWDTWFDSYNSFYLSYAELGEQLKVSAFSVGVEMVTASRQSQRFIDLVASQFSGVVTYSANWGAIGNVPPTPSPSMTTTTEKSLGTWYGEIDSLTWINQLDIIGVDAYYPLTSSHTPALSDLLFGWSSLFLTAVHLRNISQFWNKSIIFTEIGYRSINGGAINPGNWQIAGTSNLTQQALCYQSVFDTFINESWWEGIHWWMWSANPKQGGEGDTDYVPQNKPETLAVLQKYYSIINN